MGEPPSGAFDLPGSAQDLTDGSSKALRDPLRSPKALPQTPKDPSEGPQDPLQASQGPFQDLLQTPRESPGPSTGHPSTTRPLPRRPGTLPRRPTCPQGAPRNSSRPPQDPLQALPRAPETPPGPKVLGSKCGIGHLSRPWLIPSSTLVSTPHAQDTKNDQPDQYGIKDCSTI